MDVPGTDVVSGGDALLGSQSLWPNRIRRLTTNQKIGGSSPSRDYCDFCLCVLFYQNGCLLALCSHQGACTRGAMDSASDFESGGCGFESRRVFAPL